MNAQDYISSGLLEAYVLGSLDLAEAEQVAGAICRFPEVAAEIDNIEALLLRKAESEAVAPPPELQEKIWAAIVASGAVTTDGTDSISSASVVEAPPSGKPATKVIPLGGRSSSRVVSWQAAAIWLALAGSVVANYMLWSGRNADKEQVAALQQQVDTMGQRQHLLASNLDRYRQEAEMMAKPGMQPVVMQSIVKDHPMAATVYWDKAKSEAYVSIQKLPPAPEGMQYQLWAIADGKPVDIGMLDNDIVAKGGMQKVTKAVVSGQAFAISLEKAGGSPTPTPDKIYVMGKMPSA